MTVSASVVVITHSAMTLAGNILVLVSALPLIWRTVQPLIPPQYIESYAYWDAETLNDGAVVGGGRTPRWRNMGYWTVGTLLLAALDEDVIS